MTPRLKRKWIFFFLFKVMGLFFLTPVTFAAAPSLRQGITNVSDPGIIQNRLEQTEIAPTTKPVAEPQLEPEKLTPAEEALDKIKFKLKKVIFKDNKAIPEEKLQAIFQPYIDQTISVLQLQKLAKEVTTLYRQEGYILSRAILPPQEIKEGVVTVQLVEGFISEVEFQGDPGKAIIVLEKYGDNLIKVKPFKIDELERGILLMNDLPGLSVKALIKPSKTVPAGADLYLVVDRQRGQAWYTYDNFGTRYIGPQEISLQGSVYSTLFSGDNNTLRFVTVPHTTEMQYVEYTHTHPIGSHGMNYIFGATYSDTHPLFVLAPLNVRGRSTLFYTGISYPVLRTRNANITYNLTANYQNVTSDILSTPFYADRFRSIAIGGTFDKADSWQGFNNGSLSLEKGFDILGAAKHVEQSRPLGVSNYLRGMIGLSRLQFINNRFSLFGALQGQYSFEPLLATTQYAYGGSDFGRGYDPAALIGDDGLAGKMELRLNTVPEWKWLNAVQYFVFYDAGEIWNRDGVDLPAKQTAMSTGGGLRINFIPQVSGIFYLAKPLTFPIATQQVVGKYPYPVRSFFQVTLQMP